MPAVNIIFIYNPDTLWRIVKYRHFLDASVCSTYQLTETSMVNMFLPAILVSWFQTLIYVSPIVTCQTNHEECGPSWNQDAICSIVFLILLRGLISWSVLRSLFKETHRQNLQSKILRGHQKCTNNIGKYYLTYNTHSILDAKGMFKHIIYTTSVVDISNPAAFIVSITIIGSQLINVAKQLNNKLHWTTHKFLWSLLLTRLLRESVTRRNMFVIRTNMVAITRNTRWPSIMKLYGGLPYRLLLRISIQNESFKLSLCLRYMSYVNVLNRPIREIIAVPMYNNSWKTCFRFLLRLFNGKPIE